MKLVFPLKQNSKISYIFIGTGGLIRINQAVGNILGLSKGDHLLVGYDEEDNKREYIYFFPKKTEDINEGVLVQSQNKNFMLSCGRFIDFVKAEPKSYYRYEKYSHEGMNGFRIRIEQNPLKPKKYRKANNK